MARLTRHTHLDQHLDAHGERAKLLDQREGMLVGARQEAQTEKGPRAVTPEMQPHVAELMLNFHVRVLVGVGQASGSSLGWVHRFTLNQTERRGVEPTHQHWYRAWNRSAPSSSSCACCSRVRRLRACAAIAHRQNPTTQPASVDQHMTLCSHVTIVHKDECLSGRLPGLPFTMLIKRWR